MSSSSSSEIPDQLARFPSEVREAYRRYCASGDEAAVQVIVTAALRDFAPKNTALPANGELAGDMRLIEDAGYDSLAIAEIIFFFEDLFKVTIDHDNAQAVRTVDDLRNFVTRKLGERRNSA
jgi:acyl carrier protein